MQHKTLVGSAILIFATVIALVAVVASQQGSIHPASAASGCGDLDGNGIVEMIDIILVSDHWQPLAGMTPPYVKQADQNKDGVVDLITDILGVANQFGASTSCQTNTPLPKTTPAGGALAVDALGESTSLSDTVETKRSVAVGFPFQVSIHVTSNPGTIDGYGLRLHWDEALLDLNPRDANANDRWAENVGGLAGQVLGPNDDGTGSEAYIELGASNWYPGEPTWSGTGPTAQFEFTCQATGTANITLTDAGSHSVLLGRPAIEYTPALANAQINCVTGPTPTSTPLPPEMVLNVKGGDCDDPVRPTKCDVGFGSPFYIGVAALGIPANGYIGFQTFIDYGGGLIYKPAVPMLDELFWPDAPDNGFLSAEPGPGLVTHAALTSLIPPYPQSTYVGKLLAVAMNCPDASTVTTVDLLPYGDPVAGANGSAFLEYPTSNRITPKVGSLTINCVVAPTPVPCPTGGCATPTPKTPPTATPCPTPKVPADGGCATPTKQPFKGDTDGDGCPDVRENGPDETLGGLRDYLNPWDWYDVNKDGVIDLINDILGVIDHWQPNVGGAPPYNVTYDRGPTAGPNPWNMTAPDGVIDLINDVLGVIDQWSPTGCT